MGKERGKERWALLGLSRDDGGGERLHWGPGSRSTAACLPCWGTSTFQEEIGKGDACGVAARSQELAYCLGIVSGRLLLGDLGPVTQLCPDKYLLCNLKQVTSFVP